MSKKSEQQFEVIIEKLDKLLEENIKLKQQIAQKDDELAFSSSAFFANSSFSLPMIASN